MPHQNITLAMKKYIILLLLTTISLNAQKIVTKYNKYMYGGKPHVWWNQKYGSKLAKKLAVEGADSEHENAPPEKWYQWHSFTHERIPLPYLTDKNFERNWGEKHWSKMWPDFNQFSPSHLIEALGAPTSISFSKVVPYAGSDKINHAMQYYWLGKITDEREYVVLNGEVREIAGIQANLVKRKGDFTKNNVETAKRSLWVVNNAVIILHEPVHCTLNVCLPEFKCPGHGLSARQKISIIKARTVEEQEILRLGYSKQLASKFAKSKELREKLLKESKWYLEKASALRREVTIVRK